MPFTFNRPGWRCPGLPRPRNPVKFATDDSLLVFLVPDRQDDCLRGDLWRNVVRADRQRARVNLSLVMFPVILDPYLRHVPQGESKDGGNRDSGQN